MYHHVITIVLIGLSYAIRHYMEGALILFCFDLNDVFLELWKINSSLRERAHRKFFTFHDTCANITFALFFSTW